MRRLSHFLFFFVSGNLGGHQETGHSCATIRSLFVCWSQRQWPCVTICLFDWRIAYCYRIWKSFRKTLATTCNALKIVDMFFSIEISNWNMNWKEEIEFSLLLSDQESIGTRSRSNSFASCHKWLFLYWRIDLNFIWSSIQIGRLFHHLARPVEIIYQLLPVN